VAGQDRLDLPAQGPAAEQERVDHRRITFDAYDSTSYNSVGTEPILQAQPGDVRLWRGTEANEVGLVVTPQREVELVGLLAQLSQTSHVLAVGAGALFMEGAWLAVQRVAWERTEPVVRSGDRVVARTGCTISAADAVVLEDHVGIGGGVTIIDSKHTWTPGHPNVMDGPVESAPVRIGRGSWLADGAVIAAGADIGEQCAIGPNTVVSSKVPDFSIVIGNPGRVVGSTRT
jgi:acetyltransferase-like isoleucine patch superfamily enzyme